MVLALLSLVVFWFVCFVLLLAKSGDYSYSYNYNYSLREISSVHDALGHYRSGLRGERTNHEALNLQTKAKEHPAMIFETPHHPSPTSVTKPHLVSRFPAKVVATADVRGNLGPPTVVIQAEPGTDWIHDRWQAASNMHGKNIPGEHWILLEFEGSEIVADRIVLDWETAYADKYVLEASSSIAGDSDGNNNKNDKNNNNEKWILFDGRDANDVATMRSVSESGRSPGVDEPRPLHVVHEIKLSSGSNNSNQHHNKNKAFRSLKLRILKSATGWGVSLWQFDVYGYRTDELQTSR